MQYFTFLDSPVGFLKLSSNKIALQSIEFVERRQEPTTTQPDILLKTIIQLNEYFSGERKIFTITIEPSGTDFQKLIWNLVKEISFGETTAYLDIAKKSGSKLNTRAVGMANGKNPIPIIIPCHRIIGSNGKLTGYAGGLHRKKWLLQHEIAFSDNEGKLF